MSSSTIVRFPGEVVNFLVRCGVRCLLRRRIEWLSPRCRPRVMSTWLRRCGRPVLLIVPVAVTVVAFYLGHLAVVVPSVSLLGLVMFATVSRVTRYLAQCKCKIIYRLVHDP